MILYGLQYGRSMTNGQECLCIIIADIKDLCGFLKRKHNSSIQLDVLSIIPPL